MHFLKSLAVLSVCLQLSGGEKINSKMFAVESGSSGVLSNEHLLFSSNQPSVVACASQCYHESACLSFSFTGGVKQPGNCEGYSKTMTHSDAKTGVVTFGLLEKAAWLMKYCSSIVDCGSIPNVDCHQHKCVCTPGYVYSEITNQCIDAWLMKYCSSVVDCGSIPDVDCHQHKCVCTPGYFYSESTNQCIDDCPVPYLTAGFTEYYQAGIWGCNLRILYTAHADGCKQACLQETDFTCLHVEWDYTDDRCNLANVTALTVPASWGHDDDGVYWQRNCL